MKIEILASPKPPTVAVGSDGWFGGTQRWKISEIKSVLFTVEDSGLVFLFAGAAGCGYLRPAGPRAPASIRSADSHRDLTVEYLGQLF